GGEKAGAGGKADDPLGTRPAPCQRAQSDARCREGDGEREKQVCVHQAGSLATATGVCAAGGRPPSPGGSASRMASVSSVPSLRLVLSNRTTVKATSEKEMTMAVRMSACGSGLAPPTSTVSPAATSGGALTPIRPARKIDRLVALPSTSSPSTTRNTLRDI